MSNERSLDCDNCKHLIVDPIVLPCGNHSCKSHIGELLEWRSKQKGSFICNICEEEHFVPGNGFPSSKRLKRELDKVKV